jgi:hypothetical protein
MISACDLRRVIQGGPLGVSVRAAAVTVCPGGCRVSVR